MEPKQKPNAPIDKLKDLYYAIEKVDLQEVKKILDENTFQEGTITRVLAKTFNSYSYNNETIRFIIEELLK
jgi:hypothetical protein